MLVVCSMVALLLGLAGPLVGHVSAQEQVGPHALVISIDGVINPVKDRHLKRALEEAQETGATLLVIMLDTPGGLLNSTRDIVEQLLDSPLPTAVYVSPRGAQAGSAGTFITAAANFAVMAPGSNIGAATPVSATGEDLDETLASKVENDAAALIRSIAQERGRSEELLEATVREAASYSAREAVDGNVVDFIADDMDDLLAQLDGMTAETSQGPVVLETDELRTRVLEKNLLETLLEFLADPNVSFLLLTIGGLGIVIELFNPGLIAPVVVGVICLILAFVALGRCGTNPPGHRSGCCGGGGGRVRNSGHCVGGQSGHRRAAFVCAIRRRFSHIAEFGGEPVARCRNRDSDGRQRDILGSRGSQIPPGTPSGYH